VCLLSVLLTYCNPAVSATGPQGASPPVRLEGPVSIEALQGRIDYYLDTDWSRTVAGMLGADVRLFRPVTSRVPDFGYTKSRVWLRLTLENATERQHAWRLHFHENFKQVFDVFVAHPDGRIVNAIAQNLERGFDTRPIPYGELVAPLQIAPGDTVTVLIRFWSEGSSSLSFTVETQESFAAIAAARTAKNFIYYGMTLLLIIFALGALAVLRHVIFLTYAAYSGSVLLFLMHADGVAFQYLWPHAPQFNSVASVVTGSAIIVSGTLYARIFLQAARLHPRLDKVLVGLALATLAMDAAAFVVDLQILKRLLVLVAFLATLLFLAAGLIAARTRFREVRFYLFAWLGAVLSAAIMTMRHWLGFEISQDLQFDSMRIVMVFDAVMMGLAIADRYNQLRQSRQQALQASLRQAERNLMLNRRLAELDEQYALAVAAAREVGERASDAVHDLRQPLHALRLDVQTVLGGSAETAGSRDRMDTTLTYLERLVASHLQDLPAADFAAGHDHGRQHGAGPPPETDSLDTSVVLRSVYEMFLPDAEAKGLEFRFVPSSRSAAIEPLALMRILSNLVANAIKYTPSGRLLLGVRSAGERIRIEVHDTGPGLTPAEFAEVLARDVRLARDKRVAEGQGLGLAIAAHLANAQGCKLRQAEGRRTGAGFVLECPSVWRKTARRGSERSGSEREAQNTVAPEEL